MIVRGALPESRYYVLRNEIADDRSLSWAARGLLIHLLSKPSHWKVSVAALINQTKGARIKSGKDAIYAILKELEQAGYVKRQRTRLPDGKLGDVDYIVSEGRHAPLPAQPDTANPTQVRNKKKESTDTKSKDLALPERAHRGMHDELSMKKTGVKKKAGNHPIWNHALTALATDGVTERRARGCLAKLVQAVGEDEALKLLESARDEGLAGTEVIDEIMRHAFAESC